MTKKSTSDDENIFPAPTRYLIYLNEDVYKDNVVNSLEPFEELSFVKVRPFRKAHKFISWIGRRQCVKPSYLICTWREARPCIQTLTTSPHLVIVAKMLITCDAQKQLSHVKKWLAQQINIPFQIEAVTYDEAVEMMRKEGCQLSRLDQPCMDDIPDEPSVNTFGGLFAKMQQPAKIKLDPEGRFVSTLPKIGTYAKLGKRHSIDSYDVTTDQMLSSIDDEKATKSLTCSNPGATSSWMAT